MKKESKHSIYDPLQRYLSLFPKLLKYFAWHPSIIPNNINLNLNSGEFLHNPYYFILKLIFITVKFSQSLILLLSIFLISNKKEIIQKDNWNILNLLLQYFFNIFIKLKINILLILHNFLNLLNLCLN
jgi:hypothetical protein